MAEAPLGEQIGPFIFWPLLAILVGIIVWAMLKRSRQGRTGSRPAPGGKSWTRPEDYREHHRVVWDEDPAAFEADSSHVPLAVAAVFGVCSGDAWDALGYRNRRNAEEGLQEAWGIRSRAQLLGRLYWILREGHRVGFQQEIDAWSSLGDSDAKQLAKSLRKHGTQDAGEQARRMQQVHENARRIRDTRFEAWDLVRASMLCRAGYTLGWLTEAEAEDTLRLLTTPLQSLYSDWAELGEPCGGEAVGRSPVDRGKQGTKRFLKVDASGIPIGCVIAGADRHHSPLLAPHWRSSAGSESIDHGASRRRIRLRGNSRTPRHARLRLGHQHER